jgi:hypothetical protein
MTDESLHQASSLIKQEFEVADAESAHSEEELLAMLAERIAHMLETQPEYLFSMLYRMDVLEKKIRPVMDPSAPEPANIGLARLVLERQKQRIATKRSIKTEPLEGMDDWAW